MKKFILKFRKNKICIFSRNVKKKKNNNCKKIMEWLNFNKKNNLNLFTIH